MKPVPYQFSEPPGRLKKARLDNITLVPASLLPLKGTYQPLANRLPKGSILCVPGSQCQQKIVALFWTVQLGPTGPLVDNQNGDHPHFWGKLFSNVE